MSYATNIDKDTIIQLTNQERTSRGIGALKESPQLDSSASQKAADMFAKDYWDHFAPDGTSPWYFFKQAGYNYSWAGENLARDFQTSSGTVAGWMASPGHRDNMLNTNFTDIGIAVVNGTLGGEQTTLVVEHLGKPAANQSILGTGGLSKAAVSPVPAKLEDSLNSKEKKPNQATASANVGQIQERIGQAANLGFNLGTFWQGLGIGQKTTLLLLAILASLFIADSIIIFRKGISRENSHSLLHASVLILLMIAVVKGATGGVL